MEEDGLDDISNVIRRAQEAIERAKRLTRAVETVPSTTRAEEDVSSISGRTGGNAEDSNDVGLDNEARQSVSVVEQSLHGELPAIPSDGVGTGHAQALRLRAFLRLQLLTSQDILNQLQTQQQRAEDLSVRLSAIISPHTQESATSDWWVSSSGGPATVTLVPAAEPEHFSVAGVAERLAVLGAQQSSTLQQLLSLRLEQLRLRQQQLSALQELLRSEAVKIQDPTALQLSAVYQSLSLLAQSLEDMRLASAAIEAGSGALTMGSQGQDSDSLLSSLGGGGVLAETVARADRRAEHVAMMARQLLMVLREFPRAPADPTFPDPIPPQGCDEDRLSSLPSAIVCFPLPFGSEAAGSSTGPVVRVSTGGAKSVALAGEQCGICLTEFQSGERLRSCDGEIHYFHPACLFEWLRIRASCPTCRNFVDS